MQLTARISKHYQRPKLNPQAITASKLRPALGTLAASTHRQKIHILSQKTSRGRASPTHRIILKTYESIRCLAEAGNKNPEFRSLYRAQYASHMGG